MDRKLVTYFEEELTHVRRMAEEFKHLHPDVADRLQLGQNPPDPYVQQLLDGFAFLAARIQLKLDAEFPRFIESMLHTVYPHYLAPIPSMAIISVEPELDNADLAPGPTIPRDRLLSARLTAGDTVRCTYTTAQDLQVFPMRLIEARYFERDLAEIDNGWARETQARAAIRVRLQATAGLAFNQIQADKLVLHITPREDIRGILYEQLLGRSTAVVLQSASRPLKTYSVRQPAPVRGMGFEDSEALLPPGPRTFSGYRVLQEYFAFPGRFFFIEVSGLREGLARCAGQELDLIFALQQHADGLENRLRADCLALHCVPAINLFPMDDIVVALKDQREEHPLIPDRTKTLEYEVYSVDKVVGRPIGAKSGDPNYEFQPFYFAAEKENRAAGFFLTRRSTRKLTDYEMQHSPISEYLGSDVFLSLSGEAARPGNLGKLDALLVRARCSNRHVPSLHSEILFDPDVGAPVTAIQTIAKTTPRPSHIQGRLIWRVVSHLALNYRSLLSGEGESGAAVLREMLGLYLPNENDPAAAKIRALRKATAETLFHRLPVTGPIAYGRGLTIGLELDETPFKDSGVFLMGAVLDRFFSRFVTVNSFVQTRLFTPQREVFRWPISKGLRQML
jgi:type VI secretion system protein ImpG